ncbi:putative histone-lysine N-methyltransferase ATXR3 isoform X1 [Chlorella sorokiniana]|uniref:Histone-lysine N-methyltransferase ATXR3 isoform X1 n=1 Tax=Chlorella sorokiniana TaxID=3076 RepID=A0A2P6TY54_CHLSO|nr:putative histone-lysine N-methyltransferase ATXR3 isoform X1 [Chlorella sorokiniana]|eukprot:PRW58999.1 putative histone-lysine N-methyltransferase ATXR3 isoform X1 [Chlorella sorokiniana]
MSLRVRLPRASSQAYRQFRQQPEEVEDNEQQANGAEAEAQQQPEQPAAQPQEAAADGQAGGQAAQLAAALNDIKTRDSGGVLEVGPGGTSLSKLIGQVQAGQLNAAAAIRAVRALCDSAISSNWHGKRKDAAQAASDLLDEANELLADFEEAAAGQPAAPPPPPPPEPKPEPRRAALLELPPETFFLSSEVVRECLTLNIDSSILVQRRGGWPAGRKRKPEGAGGSGRRKGRRGYNPWSPELQQQLATVLSAALSGPTSPGPPQDEVAALPPALSALAGHLRSSQAGEQLQSMGASFSNAVGMLQAGAFTDFEELLSDCREEGMALVEAVLAAQSVDVRRGRLVALIESFVQMLGSSIESLLNKMRAEHKAQLAAAGLADDSDEDDEYPAYLPPCILANKEPFKGGDWRKTPYIPRPYVRLTDYDIVEPEMGAVIKRKLTTKKHGGCDGKHCLSRTDLGTYNEERAGFNSLCSCLARNTECDEHCACSAASGCLNRSVTARDTVKLGSDVQEVDSWGMDCYVRRNILDAVLESGAFGPWTAPDYKALAAASPAEYAAMREATRAPGGGAGASPAVAALPPPPMVKTQPTIKEEEEEGEEDGPGPEVKQEVKQEAAVKQEGPPATPAGARMAAVGEGGDAQRSAAVAAALASPPPTPAQIAVEKRVADWLEQVLMPAVNRQGANGWDLLAALRDVRQRAEEAKDEQGLKAAEAVEARVKDVGYNYFRLHPKGVGLVCQRAGGLPPLTFVEEYFGEIHTPWRWFEIQDAVKRITGDELPDFYNILLERPKDDPDGYDVLCVDAAAKGAFASRMSHSCTPNCQAVIMACGGRLTIALYTLRHVHEGEELTFDYSSVTESEKEFRDAICLCSTRNCRGSYLYFTGSRAFHQVMNTKHTFLHRQVILARAGSEPVTQDDWERVKRHGLGESALGSVEHGDRVPDWLVKWTSLTCEFIEEEESHLREELLAHPLGIYNEITATAEAKGVVNNRLQNIVITLDKIKRVLQAPNQPQGPCLRPLTDEETLEFLWTGPKAVSRRVLKGCIATLAPAAVAKSFAAASEVGQLQAAAQEHNGQLLEGLRAMCALVLQPAADVEDARSKLRQLYAQLRGLDLETQAGLTAAADLLLLYASTQRWMTCERGYRTIVSSPVPLNLEDLTLDRAAGTHSAEAAAAMLARADAQRAEENGGIEEEEEEEEEQQQQQQEPSGGGGGSKPASRAGSMQDVSGAATAGSEAEGGALASALRKVYRPLYVWGQLSSWFKQTVNDPTASLSAERRGTVSLPDLESAFAGSKAPYSPKDRADLAEQLEAKPEAMWRTGTLWTFKNEAKVYGSPALDAAWCELTKSGDSPLPAVLAELRSAEVPPRMQIAAAGSGGGGGATSSSGGNGKPAKPGAKKK